MTTLPPEVASVLRPVLPGLADEMIATIAAEVPEYSRAMEGVFGDVVRLGVEVALGRFVDLIEDPSHIDRERRETYVNLGRGELHAGRSLDALMMAYRIGARLAWRRFVDAGVAGGIEPEVIYRLGEAIFEYIDELSAESAEGYATEQLVEAGERRRRRARLVALLASEPPPPEQEVRAAAREASWEAPRTLAALVCAPVGAPDEAADRLGRELGLGTIAASLDDLVCALVPDPDAPGRRRQIEAVLGGARAALGPTVPLNRTPTTIRRAHAAYRLVAGEATGTLIVADDHLAELLLGADPVLAEDLAARRLAPLESLAPGARLRMTETLRAYLERPGQIQAVAAELGLHPQTIRYRLRGLRELFGADLDDPQARFELQLALRASATAERAAAA